MLLNRSSGLFFKLNSQKWSFSFKNMLLSSRFLSSNSNLAILRQQFVPNGTRKSSAALRVYSTNNKYEIHNPFESEDGAKTDSTATHIVERKPASYWKSLFSTWRTPAPAFLTGLAGLIPFAAAPSYLYFVATSFDPFVISAQLAYGAVILSFVGGIRWGFVIPYRHGSTHMVTWRSILQSVVPAMIAWTGILLPDLTAGLLTVSFGFLLALYNDLRLFGDYPKWMLGLRCLLTTIAVATLIASVVLVEENRLSKTFGNKTRNNILDKDA